MSNPPVFQSRKERREAEKSNQTTAPREVQNFEEPTLTGPVSTEKNPDIFLEPVKAANFESISNLGTEPVTASIIVQNVPDLDTNQIVLTGSRTLVKTGQIELPRVDPTTGSISIVIEGEKADDSVYEDSLNSFVTSVAPIRAAGIAKTRAKTVELTLVTRKGQGQVYAVMSTAVLMITVGALIIAAFMLGIF